MENKKIMFGVPISEIESHDPTNLITYLKELEQGEDKSSRGCVQIFGNNVFNTDEKLLKSQDFCIWSSNLFLNYRKFAFFLKPESIFLIMIADLINGSSYTITKEKQIEFLNTILPDCIDLGVEKGYTRKEMEEYYNENLFKLI